MILQFHYLLCVKKKVKSNIPLTILISFWNAEMSKTGFVNNLYSPIQY